MGLLASALVRYIRSTFAYPHEFSPPMHMWLLKFDALCVCVCECVSCVYSLHFSMTSIHFSALVLSESALPERSQLTGDRRDCVMCGLQIQYMHILL